MKEGWYNRSFEATLKNGTEIAVNVRLFLSINLDEIGIINYEITPLNKDGKIVYKPYIDAGVTNEDANWDEKFWEPLDVKKSGNEAFVTAQTFKTHFKVTTFMQNSILINGEKTSISPSNIENTVTAAEKVIQTALAKGYDQMLQDQIDAWAKIWEMSDITIDGDVKA